MKVLPIVAVASIAATSALADTKQYSFDDFTIVESSAGVKVIIQQGQDFHVEAEAIRGNLRRLEIEQRGNTLNIGRKNTWSIFGLGRRDQFEVTVILPELEAAAASSGSAMTIDGSYPNDLDLDASSGASMAFNGQASGNFSIDASSGASFSATGLTAKSVIAEASSGASVSLDGTCQEIDIDAASGASMSARDLECLSVDAHSGGGASLSVFASKEVKASASGGASLSVHGNAPVVESSSGGGASISIR